MDFLPTDPITIILSYITEIPDIAPLLRVSKRIRRLTYLSVTTIRWPSGARRGIPFKFLPRFSNVRYLEAPVIIKSMEDLESIPRLDRYCKFQIVTDLVLFTDHLWNVCCEDRCYHSSNPDLDQGSTGMGLSPIPQGSHTVNCTLLYSSTNLCRCLHRVCDYLIPRLPPTATVVITDLLRFPFKTDEDTLYDNSFICFVLKVTSDTVTIAQENYIEPIGDYRQTLDVIGRHRNIRYLITGSIEGLSSVNNLSLLETIQINIRQWCIFRNDFFEEIIRQAKKGHLRSVTGNRRFTKREMLPLIPVSSRVDYPISIHLPFLMEDVDMVISVFPYIDAIELILHEDTPTNRGHLDQLHVKSISMVIYCVDEDIIDILQPVYPMIKWSLI